MEQNEIRTFPVERREEFREGNEPRTQEAAGGVNPPGNQEKLAEDYKSLINDKGVLVRNYTASKRILNDLKTQLTSENIDALRPKIAEFEHDTQRLQSRINGIEQAADYVLSQITQETKDKYLRG